MISDWNKYSEIVLSRSSGLVVSVQVLVFSCYGSLGWYLFGTTSVFVPHRYRTNPFVW